MLSVSAPAADGATGAVLAYLATCVDPPGAAPCEVVLLAGAGATAGADHAALASRAASGACAVLLDAGALGALAPDSALLLAAGVRPRPAAPAHPIRVLPAGAGPLFERLEDLGEPVGALVGLDVVAEGVEVLVAAPTGLEQVALATWRPSTGVATVGLTVDEMVRGGALRLVHRVVLRAATRGWTPPRPGVGLLGWGAIGAEHATGFDLAGLEVVAVCDRAESRLADAAAALPGVATYAKADELLGDDAVGLVVVSTPPDSHAEWARTVLRSGRDVLVEKPLALTAADADDMLSLAAGLGRFAGVYQNRRFDSDFLALQAAVRSKRLGRVFHLEAFVGGYGHPCNYWHSDAGVSGGTAFDWGSHYLDQILALLDGPLESVRGSAHKLRWHDVSNADQMRIQLRFVDGTEVDFVHSDLAAASKPKWYVLGTEAAVVGEWRRERVLARSPIGTLVEDRMAEADAPARMWLHGGDGSRTELAQPEVVAGRYHRELADLLLLGEPATADPVQSRDVVAVLETATASAGAGGVPLPCELRGR